MKIKIILKIFKKMPKKKSKYKKSIDKNEFEKNIKYLEIKDNENNIYKYSLNNYNSNTGNDSYKCLDTYCTAR